MLRPDQDTRVVVSDWVESSKEDMQLALLALSSGYKGYAKIGFHAQQAVEKLLKALLIAHNIHPPRDHFIHCLRSLIEPLEPELAAKLEAADVLTPYAVKYRYPLRKADISREQVEEAMRVAHRSNKMLLEAIGRACRATREGERLPPRVLVAAKKEAEEPKEPTAVEAAEVAEAVEKPRRARA